MKSYSKHIFRISLIIVLFLVTNRESKAQLGFKNVTFISQDTLHFADTVKVSASLFNYDTAAVGFSGPVKFMATVNGVLTSTILPDSNTFTLPPLTGTTLLFTIPVSSPLFKVGPDVVIIWPYSAKPAHDSIVKTVFVQYHLGIESETQNNFTAHLQGNILKLDLGDSPENAQRVRIYSLIGSVLYENSGRIPLEIPLQDKQPGIYMCEILWKSNVRKVVRFLVN